jgi:phosphate/sulfate permease
LSAFDLTVPPVRRSVIQTGIATQRRSFIPLVVLAALLVATPVGAITMVKRMPSSPPTSGR